MRGALAAIEGPDLVEAHLPVYQDDLGIPEEGSVFMRNQKSGMKLNPIEAFLISYLVAIPLALYIVAAVQTIDDEDPADFDEGGLLGEYMAGERNRVRDQRRTWFDEKGRWLIAGHKSIEEGNAYYKWQMQEIERQNVLEENRAAAAPMVSNKCSEQR